MKSRWTRGRVRLAKKEIYEHTFKARRNLALGSDEESAAVLIHAQASRSSSWDFLFTHLFDFLSSDRSPKRRVVKQVVSHFPPHALTHPYLFLPNRNMHYRGAHKSGKVCLLPVTTWLMMWTTRLRWKFQIGLPKLENAALPFFVMRMMGRALWRYRCAIARCRLRLSAFPVSSWLFSRRIVVDCWFVLVDCCIWSP